MIKLTEDQKNDTKPIIKQNGKNRNWWRYYVLYFRNWAS